MYTLMLTSLCCLYSVSNVDSVALAGPKSFTDDPFIDDEKFTEKGKKSF